MQYYKIFKNIFSILSVKEKLYFVYLQGLILVSCIVELLNIFLLYVFAKLLIDSNFVFSGKYFHLFDNFNLQSEKNFKFYLLILLILTNLFNIVINLYISWHSSKICEKIYQNLSNKLYTQHISREGISSFSNTFSDYVKIILHDLTEIKIRVFAPLIALNHKIFLIFFLFLTILVLQPKLVLIVTPVLLFLYWFLFKIIKKTSIKILEKTNNSVNKKIKILNESFFGFREILLLGLQNKFFSNFKVAGAEIEYYTSLSNILSYLPRLFIEFLVFCFIVVFLFLFSQDLGSNNLILPLVIVTAFAGLKIIPALNQVYFNLMNIRNGIFYINKFKKEIKSYYGEENNNKIKYYASSRKNEYFIKKSIELKNIYLKYNNNYALKNLSCKFYTKNIIGIVGPSGSGKSSLIDVIIGFVSVIEGKFLVDGIPFKKNLIKYWQKNFFLVTQNIFLSNSTIAENIAFGVELKEIDINKVERVSKMLQLDKIIEKLPNKYFYKVNDMGIGFSNGEKQRISLARALYFDKNFLILDEATNALDSISENLILNYIKKIKNKTVILITHRLKTLKFCDQVILLDNGSLVYDGSYQRLLKNKSSFKTFINLNS
jgi:HlyD family secretion protein